jgi:DNA-binding MarR family transcriptional regulator/GNAT superfamily N-acetyltransferase
MDRVAAVRSFNRFYTNRIGVLRQGFLDTPYSLAEARVLFELGRQSRMEVADLRAELDIDAGHLSRLLTRLERRRLLKRERSAGDGRRQTVSLTRSGRAAFGVLDRRSAAQNRALLERLPTGDQRRLVAAMETVRSLLDGSSRPPFDGDSRPPAIVLRPPRAGELGWIVQRHGAVYADEYGWDERFEALVARVVADYAESHDPEREAAWIAEADGEPVGCILCVAKSPRVARLRLLLVDSRARGLGIGARLVDECVAFARRAGYREITLWTNDVLRHARPLYERAGFELVDEEPHRKFGPRVVGQNWSLKL